MHRAPATSTRRRGSGWSTCWTRWWGRPTGPTASPRARPVRVGRPADTGPGRRHSASGASAVVGPGTGDNMAAALGCRTGPRARACVSLGTSGTVYARSDRPAADPTGTVAGFADAAGRLPPPRLHPQRHPGDRTRWPVCSESSPAGLDELALTTPTGSSGTHPPALLRRRAHPGPPDRHRHPGRPAHDVSAGDWRPARSKGVVCGLLDALDALAGLGGGGRRSPAGGRRWRAVAGLPPGTGRPVRPGGGWCRTRTRPWPPARVCRPRRS